MSYIQPKHEIKFISSSTLLILLRGQITLDETGDEPNILLLNEINIVLINEIF